MEDQANPNPYEAPRADISPGAPEPATDITREEVTAYVGDRRASYFWHRWKRALSAPPESASVFLGFNWAAGFFNFLWLLYRKMYREFFIVFLVAGVGGTALSFVAPGLDRIFNIAIFVAVGTSGVGLYLRRARIVVAAARQVEPDLGKRLVLLRKKGGTSILWPLVCSALLIGAVLAGPR